MHRFANIHAHEPSLALRGDTVVSIRPGDTVEQGGTYSVGIHPWDTSEPLRLRTLVELCRQAALPQVVAIGECGYDRLRGGDMSRQRAVFELQARLAERLGKPLIIHCVKAFDELLASRRRLRPRQEWIIHGFRGKPEQARQLLAAGFSLSLGLKYNPDTEKIIPGGRLYRETDQ